MNQAILFNDDLTFDKVQKAWRCTAFMSGQLITIYFNSIRLSALDEIDTGTKFDLEESVETWLEENEPEGDIIHLNVC